MIVNELFERFVAFFVALFVVFCPMLATKERAPKKRIGKLADGHFGSVTGRNDSQS
jgi:hypothetical protein